MGRRWRRRRRPETTRWRWTEGRAVWRRPGRSQSGLEQTTIKTPGTYLATLWQIHARVVAFSSLQHDLFASEQSQVESMVRVEV